MDYKRTMYLLSLLYSSADGAAKEKIGELFKQSVLATEEYQQLKKLLTSVSFFDADGEAMHAEGEQLREKTITEIASSADNYRKITLLTQQIENEVRKSEEQLSSPAFFDRLLVALRTTQVDGYTQFYRAFAACVCYYMLSQFGAKALHNLTFQSGAQLQDLCRLVNQKYADELFLSERCKRPPAWCIEKAQFGGDNLIAYSGYRIVYAEEALRTLKEADGASGYSRIAPYVYAATSPDAKVQYIGIGNLVGVDPKDGISLLAAEITTSLPPSALSFDFVCCDLLGALKKALNTDCYCITPDDLTAALNRRNVAQTIQKRKAANQCIFCGATVSSGTICNKHLTISRQ